MKKTKKKIFHKNLISPKTPGKKKKEIRFGLLPHANGKRFLLSFFYQKLFFFFFYAVSHEQQVEYEAKKSRHFVIFFSLQQEVAKVILIRGSPVCRMRKFPLFNILKEVSKTMYVNMVSLYERLVLPRAIKTVCKCTRKNQNGKIWWVFPRSRTNNSRHKMKYLNKFCNTEIDLHFSDIHQHKLYQKG